MEEKQARSSAPLQRCIHAGSCEIKEIWNREEGRRECVQRLLRGNWSRAWVFLGPQPPPLFPQRWIHSRLPSWPEGKRRGWRKSEARPNFTFTEVRSCEPAHSPYKILSCAPAKCLWFGLHGKCVWRTELITRPLTFALAQLAARPCWT